MWPTWGNMATSKAVRNHWNTVAEGQNCIEEENVKQGLPIHFFHNSSCSECHLNQRGEGAVPIPHPLNFSTAILIMMVVQNGNLPILLADLEWADGEILIVLFEFPSFYGSLKSWVKSFVWIPKRKASFHHADLGGALLSHPSFRTFLIH